MTILAWAAGMGLVLAPVLVDLIVPPNPDLSWLLFVAERMLGGARFGKDLVEVNPPLIAWLNMPAVVLAKALGAAPIEVYQAGVALAAGACAGWCAKLLPPGHPAARSRAAAFAVGCYLLAWLPTSEFGQREHLALVLVAPYLLVAARRIDGLEIAPWEAAMAGIAAGLGFALKPFFLLPLGMVEAGLLGARRRVGLLDRPELQAILLVLAVYPAVTVVLAPGYLEVVATFWPAYRRFFPVSFTEAVGYGFTRPWVGLVAASAAGVAWCCRRWALEWVLALATVGFGAAALVQQRAWLYLWLPVLVLGWTVAVLLLTRTRDFASGRAGRLARALAVVVVIVAMGVYGMRWAIVSREKAGRAARPDSDYWIVRRYVERCGAGLPVALLAPSHGLAFPAIPDGGGQWSLRFNALWPISAALPGIGGPGPVVHELPGGGDSAARQALRITGEDLVSTPPRLLFVPVLDPTARNPAGYQRIDFVAMLSMDPAVAALFHTYTEIGRAGVLRVLLRDGERTTPECVAAG